MSEPLLKRRKRIDDDRNQGPVVALGGVWRVPAGPGQVVIRRKGGASSVQAPVRNVGTARPDVAGRVLTAVGVRENPKRLKP